MKKIIYLCLFIFVAIAGSVKAQQADENINTLIQKIDSLEKKISAIEKRISALETDKKNNLSKLGNYKIKSNWLMLEKGMSKAEVKTLLGEPGKILSGWGAYWYYPDSYGGRVEFDDNEKVTGWREP
jgi:Small protein A (tmRNA-binding)